MDLTRFTRLKYWVQMVLPLVYDDSLSYYELLAKVVEVVNGLGENYNELLTIVEEQGIDIEQMKEDISVLQGEIENIKNGKYLNVYIDALAEWIDKNLQELVTRIVKFVTFGLTDNGYFYADIPENWEFLQFGTIYDETDPNYLHLYIIF